MRGALAFLRANWLTLGLASMLAVTLLTAGVERSRRLQVVAEFATYRAEAAQARQRAEQEARAKEAEWSDKQQENANANQRDLARVRADLDAARAERGRLLVALEAWRKRAATSNPAPQGDSAGVASADPIGMFSDLLDRADIRAEATSRYADELRAAGLQCERDYEALTAK